MRLVAEFPLKRPTAAHLVRLQSTAILTRLVLAQDVNREVVTIPSVSIDRLARQHIQCLLPDHAVCSRNRTTRRSPSTEPQFCQRKWRSTGPSSGSQLKTVLVQ